ncbi:MAG: peptidoglycan-binding protein, partial [Proteobacteria bacterium]|nr:peptidoglycan-binding protein [Pseudomonadota bacterium]
MKIDFDQGMAQFSAVFAKQIEEPPSYNIAIERIAAVKADVDTAENDGFFVPLPDSEPEGSRDHSRVKTIRNRLFILGYLEKDTGRGNIDDTLKEAIQEFQKEA